MIDKVALRGTIFTHLDGLVTPAVAYSLFKKTNFKFKKLYCCGQGCKRL